MPDSTRNKEYWFVPKRSNISQMLLVLHGINIRNMNGKKWTSKKQDDLSLTLKKLGGTKSGAKIALQGIRTIIASMEYLGFVYLDESKTINITKVGEDFYNYYKGTITNKSDRLINDFLPTSDFVKKQMFKLQLTNPVLLKNCRNILVFPLKFVLSLLRKLKYLDIEELAMYVFTAKDMSEINYTIIQIQMFRQLDKSDRNKAVKSFKQSNLGNISLNKAPSTNYFIKFCTATSLLEKNKYIPENYDKKINVISIIPNKKDTIQKILNYNDDVYDFQNNLNLWIEYFGDPNVIHTPFTQFIINNSGKYILIAIEDSFKDTINIKIVENNESLKIPFFNNKYYYIKVFNIQNNIYSSNSNYIKKVKASKYNKFIKINESDILRNNNTSQNNNDLISFNDISNEIINHGESNHFSKRMENILSILRVVSGENNFYTKNLRGAYYESLFYRLLRYLEKNEIIDNVKWNGKMHSNHYGLPSHAPGGKKGEPDIIFTLNNVDYVLELTTIKSKSSQYSSEAASVPDHITRYNRNNSRKVRGIFCSPMPHQRINNIMQGTLNINNNNIYILNISDKDLIDILNSKDSTSLSNKFDQKFKDISNKN